MKPYTDRHLRRKRGIAMVWMAVAMPPMIALTGIALDMGNVALVRTRLQNYVDAEAISALKERFGKLPRQVELEDFVGKRRHGQGQSFRTAASSTSRTRSSRRPPSLYLQPLEVPARHAKITGFEVPLLFGPIVGIPSVKLDQEAVAFLGRRQVVIVQDVSGSMSQGSRMPNAKNADRSVILEMETQQIAGDQVGLVAFDDGLVTKKALTPLANGGAGSLVSIVDGWGPMGRHARFDRHQGGRRALPGAARARRRAHPDRRRRRRGLLLQASRWPRPTRPRPATSTSSRS